MTVAKRYKGRLVLFSVKTHIAGGVGQGYGGDNREKSDYVSTWYFADLKVSFRYSNVGRSSGSDFQQSSMIWYRGFGHGAGQSMRYPCCILASTSPVAIPG